MGKKDLAARELGKQGIGKRRESWFFDDLRSLKKKGLITDFKRSGWHSELDYRGIDAIVIRTDGVEVEVNVTSINQKTIEHHMKRNKELRRGEILIWGHDQSLSSDSRTQSLLEAINKF